MIKKWWSNFKKDRDEPDKECTHDWEILEVSLDYYKTGNKWYKRYNPEYISWHWDFAVRKVCLKCGKCVDEIKEAQEYLENVKETNRKRKELAEIMWENCND